MTGWFMGDDPAIAVELGECLCPETPHAGDTVWLRSELDAAGGIGVTVAMNGPVDGLDERLGMAYLVAGIERWTFVDGAGKPLLCTRENIRRLRWNAAVYKIADRASEVYQDQAIGPFLQAMEAATPSMEPSLPNGRTARSTSRKGSSSDSPRLL